MEMQWRRSSGVTALVLTPDLWPLVAVCPAGQLIAATTDEIVKAYYPSYFLLSVAGQIQTRQAQGSYDDSYLGESYSYELHTSILIQIFSQFKL